MSDIKRVLDYYELAEVAFEQGDYYKATEYYRNCYLSYEWGELPVFSQRVQDYGYSSKEKYDMLLDSDKYLTIKERAEFIHKDKQSVGSWGGISPASVFDPSYTSPKKHYNRQSSLYKLTKSSYIKGLQCPKALYLYINKRYLGQHSEDTLEKFIEGRLFESKFKKSFEKGIAIDKISNKNMEEHVRLTKKYLNEESQVTLFEAGFVYNDILVLTDVLKQNADDSFDIFEVKNSLRLTDVIISDLSVQFYVCTANLENIRSFNVVLNDGNDEFKIVDITDVVDKQTENVKQTAERLFNVLNNDMPQAEMGKQCDSPYPCEFKMYCEGKVDEDLLFFNL